MDAKIALTTGNQKKPKKRKRWFRRLLTASALLLLLLLVIHTAWGIHSASAFKEALAGYRASGERVEVGEFLMPDVPDAKNAAIPLESASASIDFESKAGQEFASLDDIPTLPLRPPEWRLIEAIVNENPNALLFAREAATRPEIQWKAKQLTPWTKKYNSDLIMVWSQKHVARLLCMAALAAENRGDDASALTRLADVLFISHAVDQLPVASTHSRANDITSNACATLVKICPYLQVGDTDAPPSSRLAPAALGPQFPRPASRRQIQDIIKTLLDDAPVLERSKQAILGERALQLEQAQSTLDGTLYARRSLVPPSDLQMKAYQGLGYLMRPMVLADAKILGDHAVATRNAMGAPDWPTYKLRAPPDLSSQLASVRFLHLYALSSRITFERWAFRDYQCLADRRLTAAVLACHLYAADHEGKLPATLDELVPAYLPAVPLDPMVANTPLSFIPSGLDPVIYSFGENGRDDQGYEPPGDHTDRRAWAERSDDVRHLRWGHMRTGPIERIGQGLEIEALE